MYVYIFGKQNQLILKRYTSTVVVHVCSIVVCTYDIEKPITLKFLQSEHVCLKMITKNVFSNKFAAVV